MLECIVCGSGPSYLKYINSYEYAQYSHLPHVGCGTVDIDLAAYCWGDPRRKASVPANPSTLIYAHPRVWLPGMIKWDETWPHGGSSGGMAVTVACRHFENVGLVGFDGYKTPEFENYDNFVACFNAEILDHWQGEDKRLYSLMDDSIFNERLLKL